MFVSRVGLKTAARLGVGALSAFAVSCASLDKSLLEEQTPAPPPAWTANPEASAPPVGDWVGAFDDPILRQLIDEALERNHSLLASAASFDQARANARASLAALLPALTADFNVGRSAIVTRPGAGAEVGVGPGGGGSGRTFVNNTRLGGSVRWELDVWGRLTDEKHAAYRDLGAAYADLEAAELSLAANVAQAWFGLIGARLQRELDERDLVARESDLRVTERRFERGVASSLDVRLSRSNLASARSSLAARQRTEQEASRRLEVLLGRYPAAELEAAASLPSLPLLAGAGAPGEILARRPDLVAAEARMESAGLRARVARKELLPQFALSTGANTSGTELSDLIDPMRLAGNIAGSISQPLFQGGRLLANAKRQRAAAEQAIYNYAQTVLAAYEEAENALAAEAFLAEQESALLVAYEEAAAAEELTRRRYESGAATIFNLLDAQTRRISSESQYISAQQNRVSNRVQLYLAIGGDFLSETKLATLERGKEN
jgi:NodT family efflux transporter outer membrane factor (OMF) lipoprotein